MEMVEVQGVEIPALGFGTWQMPDVECRRGVEHALSIGYRHIDTAQAYRNEDAVGEAIQASDVTRDEIFLTTKVWRSNYAYDDAKASIDDSLRRLDTDWVDLLLIHWPHESIPFEETLKAMKEAKEAGKVRHLGISNFTPSQLEEAERHADLLCNQVEYHPYLGQQRLLEMARERDMMLTAYSPLARGQVVGDEVLVDIGEQHGKSSAQVALRWLIQQENVSAIPKAAGAGHREANFEIFDFELTDEQMERIDALDRGERLIDPGFGPDWER